jgi:diguanylate cyclase (GGDEF)-like protein/PAS domain S-box-containing protein
VLKTQQAPAPKGSTAARILVVDDDPSALLLMRAALTKTGFTVATAGHGEEGLALFRRQPCDMVMLDVEMPGLSGFEVCAQLRTEVGEEVPIVMVTGMDDLASIERAYESGATDFIAKPINWALIGHRVRYLLRSRQLLLDLRTANARNAAVLQAIPDLLFEVDIDGRYLDYRSPRTDLLAAPPEAFLGRTLREVLPSAAAQVCMEALAEADRNGSATGKQFELQLPKGACWFELSVSRKATAAGDRPHFIVLSRDITERKEAEQRIARLAYFDGLTGLPNRQSFLERVDREIRRAETGARRLGVLFMDLDGFKNINDTMGHSAGDLILQWAADRLRQGLRPSDVVSRGGDPSADVELARLGGDEFTALILDIARPEDALVVAHRVLQLMRRPFKLNGRQLLLTASIGIAVYPEDGADAATLLKHSDTAMYHAKDLGRDNCQFYSASLTELAVKRMELESSLRQALERGEFTLAYQPQFDVAAGRIVSAEALIRWQHPTRGLVPPLEFIPLAEENGLIIPIGQWVLRTACAEAARWQRAGFGLRVAVNLSPLQFRDPMLVRNVLDALAETELRPELLELEVTESAVMEEGGATLATLEALRGAGVRVALDDFGTGYSSMSYLKRMPLNNLKIDRSFIEGLPDDGEDLAIVRAILSMARSMGFSVTAEGVETGEQAQMLKDMACDLLQGYYFSRPVPAVEISALLARQWPPADRALNVVNARR